MYGTATHIESVDSKPGETRRHEQTRVIELFMAGDIEHAKQVIRRFCMDRPCCVTATARHTSRIACRTRCLGRPACSVRTRRTPSGESFATTTPAGWARAVEIDEAVRGDGTRGQSFLHRSYVPLAQADLRTDGQKTGQQGLFVDFDNECEGMCGV